MDDSPVVVPDFRGQQALEAWLAGHDVGVLLEGPNPDSPSPVLNGRVVDQVPVAGSRLSRWGRVTVWVADADVREPRRPYPDAASGAAESEAS